MHYLLFYEKAPDHARREPQLQPAHIEHVRAAAVHGELQLGGPLLDPTDGTNVLLFRADSPAAVESFAQTDPYVTGGVVIRWRVRPWQTVVGELAECPLPQFAGLPHSRP